MSLQSTTTKTKFSPDGLNYGYWSAHLEALLEEHNILLSDDTFDKLRKDANKKDEYRRINGMAKRIIMQTGSDDHISYIKEYKNADEVWMLMKTKYESPNDVARLEKLI